MKRRDWIRLYCRMIDSPEILELEDAEFRLLVGLWCLAGSSDEPGIVRYTLRGLHRRLMPHHDESSVARMLERLVELDLLRPLDDGPGYAIPRWEQHQYVYPSWTPHAQADRRARRSAFEPVETTPVGPLTEKRAQAKIKRALEHDQAMIKPLSSDAQPVSNASQAIVQRTDSTNIHERSIDEVRLARTSTRAQSDATGATTRVVDRVSLEPSARDEKPRPDAKNDDRGTCERDQALIKRRSARDQVNPSDDQRKNKNKNKNKNENDNTYVHEALRAERSAPRARQPDPLFEALVECVYGKPYSDVELTRSERGRVNEAVRQLREIGADATAVREKASLYRARWPGVELTPTALVKHWHLFETGASAPSLALVPRAAPNGRRSNLEIALATLAELTEGKGG
jgi:hypothetical protein